MTEFDRFLRWYCADLLNEGLRQASGQWLLCAALGLEPEHQGLPAGLSFSTALLSPRAQPEPEPPVVFALPADPQPLVVFALWQPPPSQPLEPLAREQWLFWPVPRRQLHAERQTIGLRPLLRAQGDGLSHGQLQIRLPELMAGLAGDGH